MDIFIGFPSCVNDFRVFKKWALYNQWWCHGLFSKVISLQEGFAFAPYLLINNGYPLLSWLIWTQHRDGNHTSLKNLYNKMHRKRRSVVENAFEILKDTISWVSWWDIYFHFYYIKFDHFLLFYTICYSVVMKLMWNTFYICCKERKIHKKNMLLKNAM